MRPGHALLDPELTLSCPRAPTLSAGVDSLVHATEAFVARKSNPLARFFAAEGYRQVYESLPTVLHFHFPSVESSYLDELVDAVSRAGVDLFSILIDTGDITHHDPESREIDLATIRYWIDIAAEVGAEHVRIIAGDAEADEETVGLAVNGLKELASYADRQGVKTLTENFKQLARRPETVLDIVERCDGRVGLCADFGNFPEESRSEDLAAVLPKANSIHAKADYVDGEMNREAYIRNVMLAVNARFDGPMSLIYQDDGSVWDHLDEMRDVTLDVLNR